MIVECENCHTRFRLAEERIPATGAKVRCSRCKTAFIVQRPGVSRDDVIDEVVAEATGSGASSAPETTHDVFEMTGSATMTLGGDVEPSPASEKRSDPARSNEERSGEEKWEFDEEPRKGSSAGAGKPKSAAARKPAETPEADDLDSLGSPEDWDLLGSGAKRIAAEARFDAPIAAPPPRVAAVRAEPEERSAPSARSVESALAAAVADSAPAPEAPGWAKSLRDVAQAGVDGGVWIAAIALCATGLALSFSPRAEVTAVQLREPDAVFQSERLEITLRMLESGVGGEIAVVRGQLPPSARPNPRQRLRAAWLDAHGAPIAGESAIVGPPLELRDLRELSLERVRAEHQALAPRLAAGGAFEVAFASVPEGGATLSLSRERDTSLLPTVTQGGGANGEATTSSRPTLPLSSE